MCEEYKYTEDLHIEINKVYQRWNSAEKRAFPFIKFLRELRIIPSTLDHWKTCKPTHLKLMEGVKLFCEETVFDYISDDKRRVLEYVRIAQPKTEEKEETQEQDKVPLDFLIRWR